MKRFFCTVIIILFLCGCTKNSYEILIDNEFTGQISVVFKDENYNFTFRRSLPGIYSFNILDGEFSGMNIDINSKCYSMEFEGVSVNEQKLLESSFFSIFINTFDYITEYSQQLNIETLNNDIIILNGNDGNEEFIFSYDIKGNHPLEIEYMNEQLNIKFIY